jgi:hypothetical protein
MKTFRVYKPALEVLRAAPHWIGVVKQIARLALQPPLVMPATEK